MNGQNSQQSTELRQIGGITVSNVAKLPLIVVSPIVRCNYFVGLPLTTNLPWDSPPAE